MWENSNNTVKLYFIEEPDTVGSQNKTDLDVDKKKNITKIVKKKKKKGWINENAH